MTRFNNNAEGGSNGASATAADTGSGDQWTSVVGNPIYSSSAPLSDALSYVFSTTATQFVAWTDTAGASGGFRFEISVPSAPTGDHRLVDIRSSSASLGNLIMPSGTTTITGNSGTGASATSPATSALTAASKYTVTGTFAGFGGSSSSIQIKLYDSSGTLVDTKASSNGTTASTVATIRYGRPTSAASNMATGMKMDNFAQDIGNGGVEIPPVAPPAFSGSAALAGAGTLTYAATVSTSGAVSLSGAGSLTANGSPSAAGSLSLAGSGTLVGVGSPSVTGTLTLAGSGTLSPVGRPTVSGPVGLSGSGSLTGSGTPTAVGVLQLSGAGTLTFSAAGAGSGSVSLSGTGTLTLAGVPSASSSVNLAGTGTLSPSGTPAISGSGALSGAGSLSLSGQVGAAGAIGLSGTGALSASPSALQVAGAIGLAGLGALSLFGQPAGALTGALALSGEGTLAGTGRPTTTGGLQLGGIGYFAKAPGVQVGFTPSNEMVAVAWLKAAVPYLGNRVATELPSDNSSWSASGFTTVATTGGTPNTEVPVNEPVMSIDSWGVTPTSGRPPWNLAAQPAEAIKAAAVDHGMIPRILTMPAGFNLVRVFSVIPRTEPRRINSDAASYAHYSQDLEFRWVKS